MKGDAGNADALAQTLVAVEPQAVLMYLGGALGGNLMNAMWQKGGHPSFYGMSLVPGDVIAKVLGERTRGLAISQVTPYPWNEADGQIREYQRLVKSANIPLGYYSFEGYVAALVTLDALRRTKDLSRPKLHAALRSTRLRVANMDIDFNSGHHTGSRFVELVQVTRDGRFVR
jgi:ABC-type branched-subunit amino acid transport system substrate-binding protein